jgi:hypothetical protein
MAEDGLTTVKWLSSNASLYQYVANDSEGMVLGLFHIAPKILGKPLPEQAQIVKSVLPDMSRHAKNLIQERHTLSLLCRGVACKGFQTQMLPNVISAHKAFSGIHGQVS